MSKVVYIKDYLRAKKPRVVEKDPLPDLPRNTDGSPDFFRWIIENLEE